MTAYREHGHGRIRTSRAAERAINWLAALVVGLSLGALAGAGF